MNREPIPDDVKRFILVSIPSVPYLEAMLLLRSQAQHWWDGKQLAQRLYMGEKAASDLLSDLHAAGVLHATEPDATAFIYDPVSDELREIITRLAEIYSKNLVDVTNLIHSKTSKKAQHFADAFKLRKDS
jgi:hypothetical protein